jgi:hypothetical protein
MHGGFRVVSALMTVPLFCACSFLGPTMQTITIGSEPSGAEVFLNGERVGQTPLRVEVDRKGELLFEVRKPGYQAQFRTPQRALSTYGILDILGGWAFLLPFVGLFSHAAWEHQPAAFGVVLDPEPAPAQ